MFALRMGQAPIDARCSAITSSMIWSSEVRGAEPYDLFQLAHVGHAPLHVLEAKAVDFSIGLLDDLRSGAGPLLDTLGQAVDRHFLVIADVEHLTNCIGELSSRVSASTTSNTWAKQRDWSPAP